VIVCLAEGDMNGCRLLSMLALDRETACIPVLMYLTPACDSGRAGATDCAHRASSYFSSVAVN
jgi:hypothetical protein